MRCGAPRSCPIFAPAPKNHSAAVPPSAQITRGLTSSICAVSQPRQFATSARAGLRLLGGRRFSTFTTATVDRGKPTSSSNSSSSRPALPANGVPTSSSVAPGASPTNSTVAPSRGLVPGTTLVRVVTNSGQLTQPRMSSASSSQAGSDTLIHPRHPHPDARHNLVGNRAESIGPVLRGRLAFIARPEQHHLVAGREVVGGVETEVDDKLIHADRARDRAAHVAGTTT